MQSLQSLPWTEPLALAASIDDPYMALLYSAVKTGYSGRYSYLACDLAERVESADFESFGAKLSDDRPRFENMWFGYLGYGLKDCLEKLTPDRDNWLSLPDLCMMRFRSIYIFDHDRKSLALWQESPSALLPKPMPVKDIYLPGVSSLISNMSRESYLEKAAHIIERIHDGDLYQANLTRKFIGKFEEPPDYFSVFRALCAVSPAPYSAYLRLNDRCILSSSPELFLRIEPDGTVTTRPIKGSAPRFADAGQDRISAEALAESGKDRAENLMIVDLMRNDLARGCIPGSVRAQTLFEVSSHATIHHLSSTITGQKKPACTALDMVKQCFPPGSMTGAPKITAMNLCSTLEEKKRGPYSGALGWFGGDGSSELSVVIRTLLGQGVDFEFQVGGGIVADSTPENELKELLDKSAGIVSALHIEPAFMEK